MNVDEILDATYNKLSEKTGISLPECDCYCGTLIIPKWFRKALSVKFNKSCKIHDVYYESSIIDNQDADLIFLEHMRLQAGSSIYWKCIAYAMFLSVRVVQFFNRDFLNYYKGS
jgi:hypothetical protein